MIPSNPRSNAPLDPKQVDMVRHNISTRQKSLDTIKNSIAKDEVEASSHSAAIVHLEATISRAKHALTTQKTVLSDLTRMKTALYSASHVPHPDWSTQSDVQERCQGLMVDLDSQLKAQVDTLTENISQLNQYLSTLAISVQEMEIEASNRQFIRDALVQHITDTKKHQKAIKNNIKMLKPLLSISRNIPAEIWGKLFDMRVQADMAEYFDNPIDKYFPLTPMSLSQVCRFWRQVIRSERKLWSFIPTSASSMPNYDFLKYLGSLSSPEPTLVYDMSQDFVPEDDVWDPDDRVEIETRDISGFEAYRLHTIALGDYEYWPDPSLSSFRTPKSVTLQLLSAPSHHTLDTLLSPLTGYQGLEIQSRSNNLSLSPLLSVTLLQLMHLKLDLTTFQPFDISVYLGQNLQELHFTHNGANKIPPIPATFRLPKLRVLGVTPPDTDFTHSIALPALKKLILYGPKSSNSQILSLVPFADTSNFKRVQQIELRDWLLFKPQEADEWGIMTPIGHIIEKLRAIESLKCVDSVINGHALVELVTSLKNPTNATGSKLERVVVDCCTGITRGECDAVSERVEKLEVYV